jgi:hypothetical protein
MGFLAPVERYDNAATGLGLAPPVKQQGLEMTGKTSDETAVRYGLGLQRKLMDGLNAVFNAPGADALMGGPWGALGALIRAKPAAGIATQVVNESGLPQRVFHGTAKPFETFDNAKVDQSALFGGGHYFTENPSIANGYTTKGIASESVNDLPTLRDYFKPGKIVTGYAGKDKVLEFKENRRWPGDWEVLVEEVDAAGKSIGRPRWHSTSPRSSDVFPPAPNVKQASLDIKKPFDVEESVASPTSEMLDLARELYGQKHGGSAFIDRLDKEGRSKELLRYVDGEDLNYIARTLGYDGMTHIGGKNTGNEAHRVWIAFDKEQVKSSYRK